MNSLPGKPGPGPERPSALSGQWQEPEARPERRRAGRERPRASPCRPGWPQESRAGSARALPGAPQAPVASVPSPRALAVLGPAALPAGLCVPGPEGGRAGAVALPARGSAPAVPCPCSATRRGSSASARGHRRPGTAAAPGPRQPRAGRARRAPGGSAGGSRALRASAETPAPVRAAGGAQGSGTLMRAHSSVHM